MANWIPKLVYNAITITFDYPPQGKDPKGERWKFVGVSNTSKSGLEQTMIDYIENLNTLNFSHISETIKDSLETFLKTWGYLGKEFDFYFDKDVPGTKVTVTIPRNGRNTKPDIHVWDNSVNPRTPMYKFKLMLRSVE